MNLSMNYKENWQKNKANTNLKKKKLTLQIVSDHLSLSHILIIFFSSTLKFAKSKLWQKELWSYIFLWDLGLIVSHCTS